MRDGCNVSFGSVWGFVGIMITLNNRVYRVVEFDGQITVIKRSSARQWRLCPEMTARVLAGLRVCPVRVVT